MSGGEATGDTMTSVILQSRELAFGVAPLLDIPFFTINLQVINVDF